MSPSNFWKASLSLIIVVSYTWLCSVEKNNPVNLSLHVINALGQHHVEVAIIITIGEHKSRSRMRCTLIIRQKSAQNVRESVILTNDTEVWRLLSTSVSSLSADFLLRSQGCGAKTAQLWLKQPQYAIVKDNEINYIVPVPKNAFTEAVKWNIIPSS